MCGLLTLIKKDINENEINKFKLSLNKINYRGPDFSKVVKKENILFGHNRLKILDLSDKSNQPYEYKNFILLFNGCIYNFKELREELKHKYNFTTTGDTEVLMYSLIEWGEKALDKIDGMYAFLFFDGEKIMASVDFFGEKPLYLYQDNDQIMISSEISPIKSYLKEKLQVKRNNDQLKEFYHLGFLLGEKTIYQNLYKLSNKKIYFIDDQLKLDRIEKKSKINKKFNIKISDIHDELILSIKNRLNSDVLVGLFLSSGLDSTLLATIIKKELKVDIDTFSFYEKKESETIKYLKSITNYLGIKSKVINNLSHEFKNQDFKDAYQDINECDTYFPYYEMCKYLKDKTNIKVILSGMGADEIFYGYNKYEFFYKYRYLYKINEIIFNRIIFFSKKFNLNFLNKLKIFSGNNFARFLKIKNNDHDINIEKIHEFNFKKEIFEAAREFDIKNTLPISLIPALERASMRFSLESRSPYLSKKLLDLVNNLEDKSTFFKEQKFIQKQILRKYLPEKYIAKRKEGFFYKNPSVFKANTKLQNKYELNLKNFRYNQRAEIYDLFQ